MHPPQLYVRIASILAVLASATLAVPTAVNDTFTTPEDTPVSAGTTSTPILVTTFEAAGTFPLPANWDYLDTVPAAATTYPVDGEAVTWKAKEFNKTSSSVAGWKSAPMPIQGGGVDAWPSAPNVLLGIAGGGGTNTVNTYLFRTSFTMTAAEAATAWSVRVLADDGCIIYVNGVEAGRLNYDSGLAVNPSVLVGGQGGSETEYTNVPLTVPFTTGSNTLAIELHQNTNNSSDAGLDVSLAPTAANPLQGLAYTDDVDGTNRGNSATGSQDNAGNPGSSVNIVLSRGFGGGGNGNNVSGGWRKTIAVPSAGTLRIKCDARGRTVNLEDSEYVEAIVMLDGARLNISGRNYLVRRTGPNPAASPAGSGSNDSGWGTYTIETPITAGNHVITFGGFGPRPSSENNDFFESGTVNFDNIDVSLIASGGSILDNDTGGVAPVTAVKVGDPENGNLVFNANGSFTYTPFADWTGTDTFAYRAVDGTGQSSIATVTINVTPVNDPPVAVNDGPFNTVQDTPVTIPVAQSLLLNDTDVDSPAASLTAVLAAQSTNGTAVVNTNGSFTFTPAPGFAGAATFTYRASDGTLQSTPATVTINVSDVPDPPVGVADTYTAVKNTPFVVTATVPGNTTDEVLPYKSAGWHYFDSLVLANRNLGTVWRTTDYVETADWKVGPAELGFGDGDEATQVADNPDPAFDQNAGDKFATSYFRRVVAFDNFATITGVEVQLLYDDACAFYVNGANAGRTNNLPAVEQTPELAWDYLQNGNFNDNQTQTFNLPASAFQPGDNLMAAEVHQSAANSSDMSFDMRIRLTRATPAGVLANDSDPDPGQTATLTAEVVTPPQHGTLAMNANGTFTYTPANGYTGADSFTYRAKDSTNRTSAVTTASITVITGPNVAPVANPDTYALDEDTVLNVTNVVNGVLANDTDAESDPFTAVVATGPLHGTLVLNTNGTFTYTPAANYSGPDSFTYRAVDTRASAPATVTLSVDAVNDAPVAVNDTYSGDPGVPFTVTAAQGVLANDTDADPGTVLTAEVVTPPATGNLVLNANGSFTFTAAQGGNYSFTYRAKDASSQSAPATVSIALNAVPVTQPDSYTMDEDQSFHGEESSVLANDSDPEGQPLTAILVTNVQHGTLELEPDGTFHHTPAPNFFGTDSFTYRASDGIRQSAPVTVTMTVNPVNDAPVAVADVYGVRIDSVTVINAAAGVLRNDTDVDNASLIAILMTSPVTGVLTMAPDGSFTYTPQTGFSGTESFTYRVSDGSLQSSVVTVTLNVTADLNTISISEIMYNPPGAAGVQEEFIEIYNYGDAAVDLMNWEFTKGVNYVFPAGTLIPSHGYLVVPANKTAFATKYPAVTNVTSTGWGTGSSLGNGGENIRLVNDSGEQVDEVTYSDQGDWAVRKIVNVWDATNTPGAAPAPVGNLDTDPGLEWVTSADPDPEIGNGGGASIQLINFGLSNKAGANWAAATPTPGAANAAVAQTNSAPLIRDVVHSPAVPDHTQQVFVTARIDDELLTGISASLFYRTWTSNSNTPDNAAFTEVAMADNGLRGDGEANDGVFGAVIPAQALNKVVEFYVSASDATSNTRTWPAPTLDLAGANPVQNANCLYQVNEEAWSEHKPLYQVIMTGADNNSWNAGRGDAQSNVAPNCTAIFRHGGKFEVRYLAAIRTRGNSSRSDNPVNLRLDIPGDVPWNGRTAFTLNIKYSYSQFLTSRLFEAAGVPTESATVVGLRINGLNRALDGNTDARNFGYYCDLIPRGGDVAKKWFPGNDDGNSYGKIRGNQRWRVSTLPTIGAGGYAVGGYINEGYWKQTNKVQNDWTDLNAWMTSLNAGATDGSDFHTIIANTVDINEWCRLLAVASIVNHGETNMTNGDDDDYSVYFGLTDKLARIIPHDLDTCFNLNAIGLGDEQAPPTVTIYQCTDPTFIDNATLTQMDKFYRNPVIGRKFKAELRRYLDTVFAKPRFDATVDELLDSQWMGNQYTPNGDAIRTHIKTFMDTRRTTIETFLPTAFTAATSLTVQNGYPRTTSATDTGSLGGKIDPARTAEVRVNGIKVTTNPYGSTAATDNTWSAGTAVTLTPGLNSLVCNAYDENGVVFATQTVTIWYDVTGTNKSGTLAASETWTAAAGPYNVTANLTVPNNVVLTIEPGTTIYSATGADISVSGGGRIVAQGTPAKGIIFTRIPSGTGTWGGITISGATTLPTILSYVTFENNGDTAVHTQNGANVEFDHLTFKNTAEQYLSLDGSSFVVSDCVFPDSTAAFEPVHGSGGVAAGGRAIVKNCAFGKPVGYNDSFDFTGGNRPGPILHVINCTFSGSEDDMLDLDSTDAWIENCTFIHCHRSAASPDSSSAVSGGTDNNEPSQVTVINCLFYDCDNAVTMKAGPSPRPGNSAVLINNTIVHITKTGGVDTGSGAVNYDDEDVDGEGKGFYLEGNIIWDVEALTRNWVPANSALTLVNNLLPVAVPAGATASGNTVGDPMLNLSLITTPATATLAQVQAALKPQSCSPAIGSGPLGQDKGADLSRSSGIVVKTPPGNVWPASVTLTVGPGGSFTPTSQAAWDYGYTHYAYRLDGAAESAETPVAAPLTLTGLSAGIHTLVVRGKDDNGIWQTVPTTVNFTSAAVPSVVINEVLADSTTAADFIELYNWGTTAASLTGCSLTDDITLPAKFPFLSNASIPAGGYLVVDASQLGFNLSKGGETVTFFGPAGVKVDEVTFGPQITNFSLVRAANGGLPATPSPGAANTAVCRLGNAATLRINEWIGSNNIIASGDFVELYNPDPNPVSITGWSLSQDYRNEPGQNTFPANSFIAGGGFLELTADGDTAAGADHLSFKVSSLHDTLALVSPGPAYNLVDVVPVLAGNPDVSQGRTTDGGVTIGYLALPTPGFSNGSDLTADTEVMNGLRITELMFAPPGNDPEFIEFKNISNSNLTVTGVTFTSGITYSFPALTLASGDYAVITNSLAGFNTRYPGVTAVQWTGGRLDNNGETLRVETGSYGLGILDFRYEGDWYAETRSGASLEFIDPVVSPRSSWGLKASWQPSVPSPGGAGTFGVVAPPDLIIAPGSPAILHGFVYPGVHSPAGITVAWSKVSGPGTVNFTAPANRDTDATFSAQGVYELRFTATPPGGGASVSDTVMVTVTQQVETYAEWTARTLAGFSAAQQAAGADADRDGVPNGVEHVMGTNPAIPSAGPEVILNAGRLALRYNVSKTADPGIQIIPQIGTMVGTWQEGAAVLTDAVTADTGAAFTHVVTDNAPLGSAGKKFMRLKVVLPPP